MPGVADSKLYNAAVKTYAANNGGRRGNTEIIDNTEGAIFGLPTRVDMDAGVSDRYSYIFQKNENAANDPMRNLMIFQDMNSNADDRYLYAKADWRETQADIVEADTLWCGCGKLNAALSGAETSVDLVMESTEPSFYNGGTLHLADYFYLSQTIATDVTVGDSVTWNSGTSTWDKIALDKSIAHPKGRYMGDDIVMSAQAGVNTECFLTIAENLYEDEDIGNGDGSDTSPALTTLAHNTNGIVKNNPDHRPVITATCGGTTRTVNVAADGTCSGYCSAGTLNMETGVWTVDITWTTAPDNATDITVTYRERPYTYSGNVVTVELDQQVPNAYATANTWGAGCLEKDDTIPVVENWTETSASGTYDESANPLVLTNLGTVDDDITITMTGATTFSASGTYLGSLGTGTIGSDFSPLNPDTGVAVFTLSSAGWGGTWTTNETIEFTLRPSEFKTKMKQDIPAGITQTADNHIGYSVFWR